ncbi:YtpR family tRNA-binding protein [Tannockella kyphosi]|uniref:YtpR family tRNA-binding protein n=1 Tax=Tannockella kyphosi TaxID=2899121 RepID=UPI002011D97E|nr:DUF4479 domain-containing protein [Tannockella kyphosi]
MLLHAFYNQDGIGDVLLVRLGQGNTVRYEKNNDLVILYDENNKVIGYNVLSASIYFENLNTGLVKITEEFVDSMNKLLQANELELVSSDFSYKFIVGQVVEMKDHPDSDHLHVCIVNLGNESTQIVCGASNVGEGKLVVVATIGSVMPSGMIIKPSTLRKVPSNGMLCSARELKLPGAPDVPGILILNGEEYQVGQEFIF